LKATLNTIKPNQTIPVKSLRKLGDFHAKIPRQKNGIQFLTVLTKRP
jgi:hypothetical protein